MKVKLIFILSMICSEMMAQNGMLRGKIKDAISNEPIEFATAVLQNTTIATKTDEGGNFEFISLKPGLYNIEISYIGYRKKIIYEIAVDNAKPSFVEILLEKKFQDVKEVKVKARKDKTEESPLSLRAIGVNEIQRNPGGNRDISKVIQSLPGAGSSVGFRNDIIIRGGGPSENRFFLDGMEIPNLNHFATQGANGGPVGILNVDFLQDVAYYSGAFPAKRGNALSSVFDFKMKNPRTDGWHHALTVGSSDIGVRTEGPIDKKSGLMLSVRRSYLKFLFSALELPFLPTYNDIQLKYKYSINKKNEITYLMLGAYDVAVLNLDNNKTEQQKYILDVLPEQKQWSYTNGIIYKHYKANSFQSVILSRNMFDNVSDKYPGNDKTKKYTLQYRSQEIENKLNIENNLRYHAWKINYGAGAEFVKYNNRTYNELLLPNGVIDTIDYDSKISFLKYGLFGQAGRSILGELLTFSLGIRLDANTFSSKMSNPLQHISPRFSASYKLSDNFNLNFNTGRYYQVPPYTMLGFKDSNGQYINKVNNLSMMRCDHIIAGLEYSSTKNRRITLEGFYKKYNQYPLSVKRGISFANSGGDFGVVGNESFMSNSYGRAYGIELFAQQKLFKGFYGLMAITLFRSEFSNANTGSLSPSNWDQRYIVNLTAGKKLKRNWELGAKFRLTGGRPYTPYDTSFSAITYVWDLSRQGQFNFSKVNQSRLNSNHQMDIRIDKKYFFKHWNLNLYLDIQNVYGFAAKEQDILTVERDVNGNPIPDPNATFPPKYKIKFLENNNGTVLPTIGLIIEY